MKYTVTTTKVKEAKLEPQTQMAITAFAKYLKAQRKADQAEKELNQLAYQVPQKDIMTYVEITEELRKKDGE